MESQRMSFPSEINLAPPNYFNCELVEVCSFWSECQKKKKDKKKKQNFPFLFPDFSVLCSVKNNKIKALGCSECIRLL